jgi:hypothetical protein
MESKAGIARQRVFGFLSERGEWGATLPEIQHHLNMIGNTARPRRKELEEAGLVIDAGKTRKNSRGRDCIVWIAAPHKTTVETDVFKHSSLGPSAAHRWMPCPGSVAACKDYPRETNIYAAEGTAAHQVAEDCLRSGDDAEDHLGRELEVEGMTFTVSREMVDGIQLYLDVVRSDAKKMGAKILVERRVSLEKVHPGIFGTADAILIKGKLLKTYDLKYGRGIVIARENPQPLCYTVGAMLELDPKKKVEEAEMVIVQPRVTDPVKRWAVTRKYMNNFAKDLRAAAQATEAKDAPLVPGEKQCQWCDHKPNCPALEKFALDKAMAEFDEDGDLELPDVDDMGDNAMIEVLRWAPMIRGYLSAIETKAWKMLENGGAVEGYKLVDKRATRKWIDANAAVKKLMEMGLEDDEIFHAPSMLTPAQMEKLFTKDLRADMAELVVKESSGTKMVPEDDPAPAVSAGAASDFADD